MNHTKDIKALKTNTIQYRTLQTIKSLGNNVRPIEVAREMGFTESSSIAPHIKHLENNGYIERVGKRRTGGVRINVLQYGNKEN